MEQEDLDGFSDEEIEGIEKSNEIEIRLAEIQKLIHKLNWAQEKLEASIIKKYGKNLIELSVKTLDKIIVGLKKKVGEIETEGEKEESHEGELESNLGVEQKAEITFEDTEGDALFCVSNDKNYEISKSAKICSCDGFKQWGHCKHLDAAVEEGYVDPKTTAIVQAPVKESEYQIIVEGKTIQIPVKTIEKPITSELVATKMLKSILGDHPNRKDVIESYQDIEEIAADVIISLAQATGIRFYPVVREVEKAKINLGKVYQAAGGDTKYDAIVALMPDTDVTIRCKITTIAAWQDKSGNLRVGTGTKEEYMTPPELKNISKRGANFIETKCESKAFKKAIINALPITHDGLLSKIKEIFGW